MIQPNLPGAPPPTNHNPPAPNARNGESERESAPGAPPDTKPTEPSSGNDEGTGDFTIQPVEPTQRSAEAQPQGLHNPAPAPQPAAPGQPDPSAGGAAAQPPSGSTAEPSGPTTTGSHLDVRA